MSNDEIQCEPQLESIESHQIEDDSEYLCSDVLKKCQRLLDDIDELQNYISNHKRYSPIELRRFQSSIRSEVEFIKRLSDLDLSSEKDAHRVRSFNFTFYESVWTTLKKCTGVIAVSQRFYWEPPAHNKKKDKKFYSALVDIVAQDGLEWVKVCTTTQRRMIYDMAKSGLVWGSSSDESEAGDLDLEEDDDDEGLLKIAKALVKSSRVNRVRYKHPEVRIVLPRIKSGSSKEVDRLLDQIRAMGIKLQTSEEIQQAPALADCLTQIPVDRFGGFTDILNLDCTMLITIVTDMCHAQASKANWHHKNVSRQIEVEKEELLLPTTIWPIFSSRPLVCTTEAAQKLEEIVNLIGTDTEKRRTDLLMDGKLPELTREQRIEEFQKLSIYTVPKEWQLPVTVIDIDIPNTVKHLPKSAELLSKTLSDINRSVFFYGWISGRTTITTNGAVAKEIERIVETNRMNDEDAGPDVWLFPSPRSLVGMERVRGEKFRLAGAS